jgi:hypothetical protein
MRRFSALEMKAHLKPLSCASSIKFVSEQYIFYNNFINMLSPFWSYYSFFSKAFHKNVFVFYKQRVWPVISNLTLLGEVWGVQRTKFLVIFKVPVYLEQYYSNSTNFFTALYSILLCFPAVIYLPFWPYEGNFYWQIIVTVMIMTSHSQGYESSSRRNAEVGLK